MGRGLMERGLMERSAGPRLGDRRLRWALAGVLLLYGLVSLADVLAWHDPQEQFRDYPYAPPTQIHVFDDSGLTWPHVYALEVVPGTFDEYREDRNTRLPLQFWVERPTPRQFLGIDIHRQWIGVESPGTLFLLGTDRFGRDMWSRLLHGARASLYAGLLAGLLSAGLGLGLGSLAGYAGGAVDASIMRLVELVSSLPWIYLLMSFRAFMPLDLGPLQTFVLLSALIGCLGWGRTARVVRGVSAGVRQRDFVRAARGFGASHGRILRDHVWPHALPVTATQLALLIPQYILAEVSLSFFGLGMDDGHPSLGNLLAELQNVQVITNYWWMAIPAIGLVGVILSYHQVSSALQHRLGAAAD